MLVGFALDDLVADPVNLVFGEFPMSEKIPLFPDMGNQNDMFLFLKNKANQ
jgi:hypothetical protein